MTKHRVTKDDIFVEDGDAGFIYHHPLKPEEGYDPASAKPDFILPLEFELDDVNFGWLDYPEEFIPVKPKLTWKLHPRRDEDLYDAATFYSRRGIENPEDCEVYRLTFYLPNGIDYDISKCYWVIWDFTNDRAGIDFSAPSLVWTDCGSPDEAVLRYLADSMIGD